jgi:P2-related tail formation protein
MWISWVKRNGITQVMYIAKLNDRLERVKKIFSMILERVLKWYDGEGENGITSKRNFEVEVFFSSQNIDFPFYLTRLFKLFLFLLFFMLRLLRTRGF